MKKKLFICLITLVFSFTCTTGFAQNNEREVVTKATPKWVSDFGYWVVESNINTPKHNIIYFYNNDNILVYKETLEGTTLKLNKRNTKMRLKKLVDQTVAAYAQNQKADENKMLVATLVKR